MRCKALSGENDLERTLLLLKPECVQRRLMGRVLTRLEEKGLNVIAMKMLRVTPELARRHYAEHVEKAWYPNLERFFFFVDGFEHDSLV